MKDVFDKKHLKGRIAQIRFEQANLSIRQLNESCIDRPAMMIQAITNAFISVIEENERFDRHINEKERSK